MSSIGIVSNFTNHMWSHAKVNDFETQEDVSLNGFKTNIAVSIAIMIR